MSSVAICDSDGKGRETRHFYGIHVILGETYETISTYHL